MKRVYSMMAVPLVAGLLFGVAGCSDDEEAPAQATNTPIVATATKTAVGVPTATKTTGSVPTATSIPATATSIPATATHTVVVEPTETPTGPPAATDTATAVPTEGGNTPTPTETPATDILCGDEITQGTETCDDGNNKGGDGCAANCTLESDTFLNFGTSLNTQSHAVVQGIPLKLTLPITGGTILTSGTPRTTVSIGADGFTNFAIGEAPNVQVIEKNLGAIDPIIVTNLACACLRGIELQTCGGRPAVPGDNSNICTASVNPCPAEMPCEPTFGPGNSAAGVVGCAGIADLDYLSTVDHDTAEATFERTGGAVPVGSINFAYSAIGTILDGGLCNDDPGSEAKGPDGIPCTDDDPATSRGNPALQVQTTGIATAAIFNVNGTPGKNLDAISTCGTSALCVTTAMGNPKTCEELQSDPTGLCLASAFAALSQPTLNDIVVPTVFCVVPQ